jgi:hypothetical protein
MSKISRLAFFNQMPLLSAAKATYKGCLDGNFAVCCSAVLSPFMCDTFYNGIREMR